MLKKEAQQQVPERVQEPIRRESVSGLLPPHLVQARRSLAQVTLELPSEPQRKTLSKAVALPFLGTPLAGNGPTSPTSLSPSASSPAALGMASVDMRSSSGMPVSIRRSKSRHVL